MARHPASYLTKGSGLRLRLGRIVSHGRCPFFRRTAARIELKAVEDYSERVATVIILSIDRPLCVCARAADFMTPHDLTWTEKHVCIQSPLLAWFDTLSR
jgi:hypothetical protein